MSSTDTSPAAAPAAASPGDAADSLRERKKAQTRQAIHEAALRLIEQHGLEATTIEQICAEAEVSPRTFFNYFPSKPAAALDLPERIIDPGTLDRFRAATGDLVPALCSLIIDMGAAGPKRARMKELVIRRPELVPPLSQWMTGLRGDLVDLAAERAASREQAELAVTLVMAALGFVLHHEEQDDDAPLAVRLRAAIDRLVAVNTASLA
ncbi:TetR/AcrR family transcriptional regulator [Schumannella sp. 10F1B-5-1]|uniref:TetR/AcrR family transcriptional regulator n=1 Tax=Schumannella sp. 10F1B-5-1 TaxID=2590780 RepID=UPI00113058BC|nr:TetR family transcriptional regulator [Schumannella sp. 10F1B-5-1]TPW76697.1 TetR family transcriptional regulator [Schumannella sp. 10F1B-5-1]